MFHGNFVKIQEARSVLCLMFWNYYCIWNNANDTAEEDKRQMKI